MKNKAGESSRSNKKLSKPKKHKKRNRQRNRRGKARRSLRDQNREQKKYPITKPGRNLSFVPSSFNMSGNCFWLNYNSVFQWKDYYMNSLSIPKTNVLPRRKYQEGGEIAVTISQPDSNEYTEEYELPEETIDEDIECSEDDEDIVVTEEMMQFLEISIRHKADMKLKKEKEEEAIKKKQNAKSSRDDVEECQQPSEEAQDLKRQDELALLYGKSAAKIHGMETALMLTFNRQVDMFNPPYWPVHPFSIQFSNAVNSQP